MMFHGKQWNTPIILNDVPWGTINIPRRSRGFFIRSLLLNHSPSEWFFIIQKRGRPGWFPKAAPVRGLYFLVHPALQALGLSCAQPSAHKAVVLQGKPAATLCQQL